MLCLACGLIHVVIPLKLNTEQIISPRRLTRMKQTQLVEVEMKRWLSLILTNISLRSIYIDKGNVFVCAVNAHKINAIGMNLWVWLLREEKALSRKGKSCKMESKVSWTIVSHNVLIQSSNLPPFSNEILCKAVNYFHLTFLIVPFLFRLYGESFIQQLSYFYFMFQFWIYTAKSVIKMR